MGIVDDLPMEYPNREPQRCSEPGKKAGLTGGTWVRNRQVRGPRKSALKETAFHPGGAALRPDNRWGFGLVRPAEALAAL